MKLPILGDGTIFDGELTTGRFATTMSALLGSKAHWASLRFVAFDLPILAGVDLRPMSWQERRDRLELLAEAFEPPLELSPVVEPHRARGAMQNGRLEGIVKDRQSTSRDGSRGGWTKVKDRSWYEREAWRFERR